MVRALADLGVAVAAPPPLEPSVLRAATVLFASEPRDFIRGAAVQLVRRAGVGPGPGPLPGHITVDNMRDEHYSRNPRIMRVLTARGKSPRCIRQASHPG